MWLDAQQAFWCPRIHICWSCNDRVARERNLVRDHIAMYIIINKYWSTLEISSHSLTVPLEHAASLGRNPTTARQRTLPQVVTRRPHQGSREHAPKIGEWMANMLQWTQNRCFSTSRTMLLSLNHGSERVGSCPEVSSVLRLFAGGWSGSGEVSGTGNCLFRTKKSPFPY
jgi:hypothetical protein